MKTRTTMILVAAVVVLSFAFTAFVTPKAVKAAIATLIRDKDNAGRRPFTTNCSIVGAVFSGICSTLSIPGGEEVVIETVSVTGTTTTPNAPLQVLFSTTAAGVQANYGINVVSSALSGLAVTQPVRLYADPGTSIVCSVQTNTGFSTVCQFSGYSVSLP
jgi:hypothetical protein